MNLTQSKQDDGISLQGEDGNGGGDGGGGEGGGDGGSSSSSEAVLCPKSKQNITACNAKFAGWRCMLSAAVSIKHNSLAA